MKTKHTPGPWKVHGNIGRKCEIGVIADAAPCIVAIMGNSKEWPAEADANAALIAAAPELLDSLRTLAAEMLRVLNHQRRQGITDIAATQALVDADALLARVSS